MNSYDELVKALAELENKVVEPIEYRIHYDTAGNITKCTMRDHPADTRYLVVTKDEYDNYFKYVIVNGKLKKIDRSPGTSVQLKKGNTGYAVAKGNAGIIIESNETYTGIEYYEDRNY